MFMLYGAILSMLVMIIIFWIKKDLVKKMTNGSLENQEDITKYWSAGGVFFWLIFSSIIGYKMGEKDWGFIFIFIPPVIYFGIQVVLYDFFISFFFLEKEEE